MDDSQEKQSQLVDRVETKRVERYRKLMLYSSVILLVCGIYKFYRYTTTTGFRNAGWWFDAILFIIIPVYTLINLKKNTAGRIHQFIEWYTDKIVFNSGTNEVAILLNQIKSIEVKLDTIEIQTIDHNNQSLNLFDYTDYDMRKRIKKNFDDLKVRF
jgi:hypothetical protein